MMPERFYRLLRVSVIALALSFAGCSDNDSVVNDSPDDPVCDTVHYVAIDIDDIFMPCWDYDLHKYSTVKMNEDDVRALVDLSNMIRSHFGVDFRFTVGYNSSFFDSTHSGDRAMLEYASQFSWFNHLPNHEHVTGQSLTFAAIDSLFAIGRRFEEQHGFSAYVGSYCITPQHEGIWPPYDPLYDAFEKYGIRFATSPYVFRPASYGSVRIMYRTNLGLGSDHYAMSQVGINKIAACVDSAYATVLENRTVVFNVHQANFAIDRVGATLIEQLIERLIAQEDSTIVFLPAEKVVALAHRNIYTESDLPE